MSRTARNVSRFAARTLAVAAFVVAIGSAHATLVLQLSDDELVRASTMIATGDVVAIDVVEYDVGPGVFTEVRVIIDEHFLLVAEPPTEVVLRVPGGTDPTEHVTVAGMPSFALGEYVMLFLEPLPDAFGPEAAPAWLPVGLGQGVWRVEDGRWQRAAQPGLFRPGGATTEIAPSGLSVDEVRDLVDRVAETP